MYVQAQSRGVQGMQRSAVLVELLLLMLYPLFVDNGTNHTKTNAIIPVDDVTALKNRNKIHL